MIIEDGKFYFIKDEFFDIFKDYKLMENKECGNKRPCYFCFRDRKNKEIIWLNGEEDIHLNLDMIIKQQGFRGLIHRHYR